MAFFSDVKVLYHLALAPRSRGTQAERMEGFYRGQADAYDDFRERLLPGRRQMLESLPWDQLEGGIWVDLGAGTGASAEMVEPRLSRFRAVYQVDLSSSLLRMAEARARRKQWRHVHPVLADATTYLPPEGPVSLVTFSYSLTMIPDWMKAIEHAARLLRPGGIVGVVDFFVSRKFEPEGFGSHRWLTRTFWPTWFGMDNVFLSPDHRHFLARRFEPLRREEGRAKVPYLPLGRVPYYWFHGKSTA